MHRGKQFFSALEQSLSNWFLFGKEKNKPIQLEIFSDYAGEFSVNQLYELVAVAQPVAQKKLLAVVAVDLIELEIVFDGAQLLSISDLKPVNAFTAKRRSKFQTAFHWDNRMHKQRMIEPSFELSYAGLLASRPKLN